MTDTDIELVITGHAHRKMMAKGIDEDQIKTVIARGSRIRQTDGFKSVYRYIGVCYKIHGKKHIIKTVTIE